MGKSSFNPINLSKYLIQKVAIIIANGLRINEEFALIGYRQYESNELLKTEIE